MVIGRPEHLTFNGDRNRDTVSYSERANTIADETTNSDGRGMFSIHSSRLIIADDYNQLKERIREAVGKSLDLCFPNTPAYNRNHFNFTFRFENVEDNEFWGNLSRGGGHVFFSGDE